MKNLNQKGFATLEAILVVSIISLLVFVGVPKMSKILDTLWLNYEVERFCSAVDFGRNLNRSSAYDAGIFDSYFDGGDGLTLDIYYDLNGYELHQGEKIVGQPYRLKNGITLKWHEGALEKIIFSGGQSGTVRFASQFGKVVEVNIDSVGRVRGKISEN